MIKDFTPIWMSVTELYTSHNHFNCKQASSSVQIKPEFLQTSHRDSQYLPPTALFSLCPSRQISGLLWKGTQRIEDVEERFRCAPVEEEICPTAYSCDGSGSKQTRSKNECNQTCSRAKRLIYPEGFDINCDRHSHQHQTPMGMHKILILINSRVSYSHFLLIVLIRQRKAHPRQLESKVPITHTNHSLMTRRTRKESRMTHNYHKIGFERLVRLPRFYFDGAQSCVAPKK